MIESDAGADRQISRRTLIQSAGAVAAVGVAGPLLPAGALAATPPSPELATTFEALSRFLTGKASLDADLRGALLQAFVANDSAFPEKIAKLQSFIQQTAATPDDLHARLVSVDPTLVALPAGILQGWYLGVVGSGATAVCVAYAETLSNKAVADVLSPPSYAYGVYGSWESKPI